MCQELRILNRELLGLGVRILNRELLGLGVRILNIERLCWCLGSVDTLNIRTVPFRRHIFADVDAVRVVVSRHGVVCNVPAWRW